MNNRRKLIVAVGAGALSVPLSCFTQPQPAKVARIGVLGAVSAAGYAKLVEALRVGLRELGYVEGRNLVIEFRWAEGKYDRLLELAAELVRLNVDVIVTAGTPGVRAAKQATATIPIVMAQIADPIAIGVVTNLARPSGNITGLTYFVPELMAKRLELLKESMPRIRQVAVLLNQDNVVKGPILESMAVTAKSLNVELQRFELRGPDEFDNSFAAMSKRRIDGVVVQEDAMLVVNASAVATLAAKHRIPSIGFVEIVEGGGLMAYGVKSPEMWRHAAVLVDKILKGAKPGDLPIERATKFEMIVNMKCARALGITIPQSILVRADRVIE
jgi:putative ABC transport system substrate-binding protein